LPLTYIVVPKNLRESGGSEIDTTAFVERKTPREKSVGEIPSRRGEIVAIVIAITLDFIGIIIITITSTFILTITMPSRCIILG
jgi:hypothetical protein